MEEGMDTGDSNQNAIGNDNCQKCHLFPVAAKAICAYEHGLCGKCVHKYLDEDYSLRCPVCYTAPAGSLVPSHTPMSAGMTPGRTRHVSNTEETSPLKREHSKNQRSIFHTLEEYASNKSAPVKLDLSSLGEKLSLHVATHPETDQIFISNFLQHQINVFSRDGMYDSSFGRAGVLIGELDDPSGLSVNEVGEVAIADTGNKRLQLRGVAGSGPWQPAYGSKEESVFFTLRGVAYAENRHRIFCADFKHVKVVNLVTQTVTQGFTDPSIESLYDVAADEKYVYASSQCKGVVYQFDHLTGAPMKTICDERYMQQRFAGITLDGRGNLLVCDQMNNCLKVFETETGKSHGDWKLPGRPYSVAVQRGTMNIVVSYCATEEVFQEGVVAMLSDPDRITSPFPSQ